MADGPHVPLKRNASESDISSSDFSADDSIADRDYRPTVSGSKSSCESEYSISGEESSDENFEEPVQNVTQQAGTSRGVLVTPDEKKREKKKAPNQTKSWMQKKCREGLLGKETDILNSFWNLGTYKAQNTYLFGSIKAVPKKRSYKKKIKRRESPRKVTYQYFVKVNGIDIQLCKQEFLVSHGLQKSSKRVRLICNQTGEVFHKMTREENTAIGQIEHQKYLLNICFCYQGIPICLAIGISPKFKKHKRYLRQIYCPEDWYEAVRKSKRANPFKVIVMEQKYFLSFQKVPMVKKHN
ncbi:unnamed protein product [Psylliodes chrysocephalus]|uniref:Uncharacterized protein n=1 Tax=Psylliodes chrysocephalus TaxID=3402493 RepID=A0A9P0CVK8_9CUCU|nr:unnamed protein product [Psylliodes chrysocephala]